MSIKEYIGGQCANPEGLGGIACAKFMNFFNAEHYRAVKKFVCKLDGARILDMQKQKVVYENLLSVESSEKVIDILRNLIYYKCME